MCRGFGYMIDFEQSWILYFCIVKNVAIWLCQKTSSLRRLWQSLLLWIDSIISKCLYIKAYNISYCPQPLGELVQRIQLIQGVVWLCCVSWINKSDRQRTVQDLHYVKALANRTSDNRLHRCHPWVNPWKGGHQPGHQDTNNKSMNDTWKNVENCGGLAAWPTLNHWHLQSWMLRCASRVPNITKAVEVRFGSVMMLSTLAAQQETKNKHGIVRRFGCNFGTSKGVLVTLKSYQDSPSFQVKITSQKAPGGSPNGTQDLR